MKKNTNSVLKEALERVKPNEEELRIINSLIKEFIKLLEKGKKSLKISAEIFVGGSSAKGTIIKKEHYDIDVFIRFDKKYFGNDKKGNVSDLTEKMLKNIKNKQRIHGSRDYFRIKASKNLFFEIVPVKKIKNQKEAENITDLSYFHVNYVKRKLKVKFLDEVRLAKAFCHAAGCYGAESYIKGFSGYALELLIYHYGSFLKFIAAMSKVNAREKLVIDTEKQYKNKNIVLMDVNAAKLKSPVVLIDPTHKQRNVLAALSEETFKKFQKACTDFLKNPSIKSFENKGVDFETLKENAKKKKNEFVLLEAMTDRQEGDIAGSKLLKFYNHLAGEIIRHYEIKGRAFEYDNKKTAKFAFSVKRKKDVLRIGPRINDEKNVKRFKARHKKTFIKNGRVYAKESISFSLRRFLKNWIKKNRAKLKEMYIVNLVF